MLTAQQRKANRRLGLILAALAFGSGLLFMAKMAWL